MVTIMTVIMKFQMRNHASHMVPTRMSMMLMMIMTIIISMIIMILTIIMSIIMMELMKALVRPPGARGRMKGSTLGMH